MNRPITCQVLQTLFITLFLTLSGGSLSAQMHRADYGELAQTLDGRITFETLPQRPEPGFSLDLAMHTAGAWLGERFAGQMVVGATFDQLLGAPANPLAILAGRTGRNLSIAMHRGFGSNALFPLGMDGFPNLTARGEGAVAILFNRDQSAFGFRVHSDYYNPAGLNAKPGIIRIVVFTRNGALIGETTHQLGHDITEIGLRRDGDIPDIGGITITNTDPGGIAIDDIVYQLRADTG